LGERCQSSYDFNVIHISRIPDMRTLSRWSDAGSASMDFARWGGTTGIPPPTRSSVDREGQQTD
jgi:hypothetical protein